MPLKGEKLKKEITAQQRANKLLRARAKGVDIGEKAGLVSSAYTRAIKRKKQQYR